MRSAIFSALIAGALLTVVAPLMAEGSAALGENGAIYRLHSGTYGELFPEGNEAQPAHEVLALEINDENGRDLLLVPETASAAAEVGPTLVLDKPTGAVYLLWEGLLNQVHAVLHLVSYSDDGWSPVLEITGNPYTRKAAPQLVVTRDTWVEFKPPLPPTTLERVALHVSWWEETAIGSRKWYAPIMVENGRRLTWVPSWNASDFLPLVDDAPLTDATTALQIQPGWNDRAVLLGFLSTEGGRIAAVEFEVLPGELDSLADWARWQIINGFVDLDDPAELAIAIEEALLTYGAEIGFHPASLAHIAREARTVVAAATEPLTPAGREVIANKGRWQIVNGGVKIGATGMLDIDDFEILEIERPDTPESKHLIKATLRSVRPSPDNIGSDSRLFLSERGDHVIIAWQVEGAIIYIESDGDGWAPRQTLVLDDDLDADAAFSLLERRARSH